MDMNSLGTVNEDVGAPLELKDVLDDVMMDDESGKPLTMDVAGSFSERYKTAQKKEAKRLAEQQSRRGNRKPIDPDDLDASSIRIQTACIVSWPFTANGKPLPITAENWTALLGQQPQWQEQVAGAIHDHARFFGKS